MTAPIGALGPSCTRILLSFPEAYASTSMLALSLSISTRGSPFLTSSPSFFSQRRILPVSIESDSRGICTLAISGSLVLAEQGPGCDNNVGASRERNLFQLLVVRRGHLGRADPGDRGIEVVARLFINAGRDLAPHPEAAPSFLDRDDPTRLLDRLDDRRHVERSQGAHVDDLGTDALLLELGGGIHGPDQHPRGGADG